MRSEKRIEPFLKWLTGVWLEHQDLRFGQLLINLGIVEDSVKTWNLEMSDYPIPHQYIREIQTWGTYGKGGGGEYKEVYIKDLDSDHINAILETQKHISNSLKKILKEELKYRENNEQ